MEIEMVMMMLMEEGLMKYKWPSEVVDVDVDVVETVDDIVKVVEDNVVVEVRSFHWLR